MSNKLSVTTKLTYLSVQNSTNSDHVFANIVGCIYQEEAANKTLDDTQGMYWALESHMIYIKFAPLIGGVHLSYLIFDSILYNLK